MEEEVSIRNMHKECLTEMTENFTADRCPTCQQPASYARELDRYVHDDGSDNRRCWLAVARGGATAPIRPVDGSVITDISAFRLRLHGQRVVRATNNLLRAVERRTRDDVGTAAVLRYLLANLHGSSAADGELWLTDPQPALHGLALWAQRDPDGYVLLLPVDA